MLCHSRNFYQRLSITLLFAIGSQSAPACAAHHKPKKQEPQITHPAIEMPSEFQLIKRSLALCDAQLAENAIKRSGFNGSIHGPISDQDMEKIVTFLEVKDIIAIVQKYIVGFPTNKEPFAWDIVRLRILIAMSEEHLNNNVRLQKDFTKNSHYYKQEFGIADFDSFKQAFSNLIITAKELHTALTRSRKLTTPFVIASLKIFLDNLQKRMPYKISQMIAKENSSKTMSQQIQMVSQVRERLSRN